MIRTAMPPLVPVLPELMLAVAAMVLLMVGVYGSRRAVQFIYGMAIAALLLTAVMVVYLPAGTLTTFGDSFVVDDFARFLKVLALVGSAASIAMSTDYLHALRQDRFEYPILIMLSTVGMMMLISANDLIALYLGLETMSLALYVVAAFHRTDTRATEAGLKYFVLGALSSGMLLYGASLIYGFTGTVNFSGIAAAAKKAVTGVGAPS